jgi:hypothetical protein
MRKVCSSIRFRNVNVPISKRYSFKQTGVLKKLENVLSTKWYSALELAKICRCSSLYLSRLLVRLRRLGVVEYRSHNEKGWNLHGEWRLAKEALAW